MFKKRKSSFLLQQNQRMGCGKVSIPLKEERLGQVENKMKRKDGGGGKGRKTDKDRV